MASKTIPATAMGAAILLTLGSCTENVRTQQVSVPAPPPLANEPIGVQITRAEPRLAGTPFRVLLDFERPTDLAFVAAPAGAAQSSPDHAHTGASALKVAPSTDVAVKLTSVVSGAFPGTWTLAGAYFYGADDNAAAPATVTVAYRTASAPAPLLERTVPLSQPGKWQGVFLDLTNLQTPADEAGLLTFRVNGPAAVYCDDVTVINNARTLEAPADAAAPDAGWTIRQGGLAITVERPQRFKFTLKTPEAVPDGWTSEEAGPARARFASVTGKAWTIYPDGRQYQDGKFNSQGSPADAARLFAQQHEAPAELVVAEEFGRVHRDTPGDRNNDGYNELRGAYELIARGNRFEVTIRPNTPTLLKPILEIARLPAGEVLATVEGRLIENPVRLPDDTLLLELPMAIDHPTTVNVRVR